MFSRKGACTASSSWCAMTPEDERQMKGCTALIQCYTTTWSWTYRDIAEHDGIPILFGRQVLDWFTAEFNPQYVDACSVVFNCLSVVNYCRSSKQDNCFNLTATNAYILRDSHFSILRRTKSPFLQRDWPQNILTIKRRLDGQKCCILNPIKMTLILSSTVWSIIKEMWNLASSHFLALHLIFKNSALRTSPRTWCTPP